MKTVRLMLRFMLCVVGKYTLNACSSIPLAKFVQRRDAGEYNALAGFCSLQIISGGHQFRSYFHPDYSFVCRRGSLAPSLQGGEGKQGRNEWGAIPGRNFHS